MTTNIAIWIHVWPYYRENWVEDTFWPKVWLSWQKGAKAIDQHLTVLEWKKKLSLYFCLIVMEWNEFWLEGKICTNTLTLPCKEQHLLEGRGGSYMRLIEQKLSAESRVISRPLASDELERAHVWNCINAQTQKYKYKDVQSLSHNVIHGFACVCTSMQIADAEFKGWGKTSTAGNLGARSQKKLGVENWVKESEERWWRLQNSWESFQAAAPNRVTMPWALRSQSSPAGGPLDPINT